jgi:hypothetical protein
MHPDTVLHEHDQENVLLPTVLMDNCAELRVNISSHFPCGYSQFVSGHVHEHMSFQLLCRRIRCIRSFPKNEVYPFDFNSFRQTAVRDLQQCITYVSPCDITEFTTANYNRYMNILLLLTTRINMMLLLHLQLRD